MADTRSLPKATVDNSPRFPSPPVGSVLTFSRNGRASSFSWDSNTAGQALVRLYLFCGWTLVSGRAGS